MKTPLLLSAFLALLVPANAQDPNQLLNLRGVPREERTILPVETVWPEKPGDAAICLWKDDKTAVISYTIDDNCAMNIDWWLKETADRDMKVTWFLVAGGISTSNPAMNATWERWKEVLDQGHGLESHTVTHLGGSRNMDTWQGIEWEYEESRRLMEEKLPGHKVTSVAYPGGNYPGKNDPDTAARHYASGRGTKGVLNGPQGGNYLSVNAMTKPNLGERPEKSFNNADLLLDPSANAYRGWVVIIYHYVKESDPEAVARMRGHLDYYVRHKDRLWCGRYGDVIRYAQSRETARLEVTENTPDRIALNLTDRMDDRVYDFPLTVKVRLPDAWKQAKAQQNGQPAAVRIIEHGGARFALVDVVPDQGQTVLTP